MKSLTISEPGLLLETLFKSHPALKKTKVKQMLKFGSVLVNGRVITSHRHELKPGDTLRFLSEKEALGEQLKCDLDFSIVYEDDQIVLVDKPAGLLTMGTEDEKEDTVYFQLTEYQRTKSSNRRSRIFIVHRLDRDSSGLVLFAKTEPIKRVLQKNWENVIKKYYAVTEGVPATKETTLKSYLMEDEFRRVYSVRTPTDEAKLAITHYRVVRDNGQYALLDVTLKTGRKNQIRVHLSDLGHPIAGDLKYGARSNPIRRLCLHAYWLTLKHPLTGQQKTFESKIPQSFLKLIH